MAKFYGTVKGMAKTEGTRRGGREIKVSAQSWDGSVITRLNYDDQDNLIVQIEIDDDSSSNGDCYFNGTLDELKELLRNSDEILKKVG